MVPLLSYITVKVLSIFYPIYYFNALISPIIAITLYAKRTSCKRLALIASSLSITITSSKNLLMAGTKVAGTATTAV